MKALFINGYGGPEAMVIGQFDNPVPGDNDVLVNVRAASVNPIDWKMRQGYLHAIFPLTFPRVLGRDFSGIVVDKGSAVTGFDVGDAVYGIGGSLRDGSHAEQMAVDASMAAPKPSAVSHTEAAATGVAALTALAALDRDATIQKGDRVLIHAGAGGVGCYAIQYAASRGAHVIATCSAGNADYVRDMGAAEIIDYRAGDFAKQVSDCDWVFDTVGGDVHVRSQAVLKPGGTLLVINTGPLPHYDPRADISITHSMVPGGRTALDRLSALLEDGTQKPVVTETFALDDAADAYRQSQAGHTRGKLVIEMR